MGNGSLRFKDNSGNVISFISGSGTDIVISGGTLNLLGMTEVALGNVTISGSTLVNGTQGNQGPQGMNGFQGPTGLQGTTGSNGAQGNQGPTGFQGSTGEQGPTGLQGNQGTTGTQGNQGPTGVQGTNGTVGTQGNQGSQGNQGPTGLQGSQGNQGPNGLQGPQGNQGPTGLQGNQGNQGPTGLQGNQGNQGPNGLQGSQGNQGPNGLQGSQGNQGPTGLQGTVGTTGLQGFQGRQGPTGLQGFQGNQGPTGLQGFQGNQGPTGLQGTTGASAGITGYTNSGDNRILTSVNSTSINAESNLTFDGTNLGIGTTSPSRGLTINRSDEFASLNIIKNNTGNQIAYLGTGSSGAGDGGILQLSDAGVVKVQLYTAGNSYLNGGNVGIGTTSPGWKLDVRGVMTIETNGNDYGVTNTNYVARFVPATGTGGVVLAHNSSISRGYVGSSGSGSSLGFITNLSGVNNERMTILENGNVGIGTTTPLNLFEVSKSNENSSTSLRITNLFNATSSTDETADIDFYQGSGGGYFTSGRIRSFREGDYFSSNSQITGGLSFWTQSSNVNPSNGFTEKMRITANGKVGINTMTPRVLFDVAGQCMVGGLNKSVADDNFFSFSSSENFGSSFRLGVSRTSSGAGASYSLQSIEDGVAFRDLLLQPTGGKLGIGTLTATSDLSFRGSSQVTIGMERVTNSNLQGNNLIISASSATIGATDKNGGDVIISGGVATGTGSSRIVFRTATANFSTGTGDRTPSDKVIITGNGTIIQNGVSSTFVTGTCTANQTVNISFTTVTGGRLRVHAIITPTDGTSIGAQKMSVIGNSTGGISEVVISNTTTATIGSWTFSGSGTFFGVTKNAGSAATACTYLIEVMGNLA